MFCAWEELADCEAADPEDWRTGDEGKLPAEEDCLGKSKLPGPDMLGIPTRSENG